MRAVNMSIDISKYLDLFVLVVELGIELGSLG